MESAQTLRREVLAPVAATIVGVSCGIGEALPDTTTIEDEGINTTPVPTFAAVIQEGPLFEDDFSKGAGDWFVEEAPEDSLPHLEVRIGSTWRSPRLDLGIGAGQSCSEHTRWRKSGKRQLTCWQGTGPGASVLFLIGFASNARMS